MSASEAVRGKADVVSPLAGRYLTQLCKHFQHKIPVELADTSGRITFPMGTCALQAAEGVLTLSVEAADAPALTQLQDVVARHLLRFAFREDVRIDWQAV